MGRRRLLWKLYPSYLLVTLLALLAITWYASDATRRFFHRQTTQVLEARARVLGRTMVQRLALTHTDEIDAFCKEMGQVSATRITVILPTGVVVGDSDANPTTMENHADRPEVIEALSGGTGHAQRESPTLKEQMLYVAVAVSDSQGRRWVVRSAMSLHYIDHVVRGLQLRILFAGVAIALLSAVICLLVSRRIARPMEEIRHGVQRMAGGDLEHRLPLYSIEEIASLTSAINEMAEQLRERLHALTAQRNEQDAVFASMAEGVMAVDTHEHVLRINQAAAQILDLSPAAAQGKSVPEVVRNTDLQRFVTRTLTASDPTEGEIILRGNGERWLQAHGAIMNDASGRQMGAVIVLNDLTHVRRLEGFRRDFVANVSHELRTPITSIKGFVETLLDGAMDEPESAKRFLGIVARQVDRLNAIISDLLLLSQLDQGGERKPLSVERTPICNVVAMAVEICQAKAESKHMTVRVECDPHLAAPINVPLIEQALVNLIDNALKYSEAGKSVYVAAEHVANQLMIEVRDEGPGIPAEHVPRLFERFYRVDKGRSREMGGTGLGLAIVKHIAQAHGGAVSVESVYGKGSTFTLSLPDEETNGRTPPSGRPG